MVSGGVSFAPNPPDGTIFWLEPFETFASTIVRERGVDQRASDSLDAVRVRGAAAVLELRPLARAPIWSRLPLRRYQVSD